MKNLFFITIAGILLFGCAQPVTITSKPLELNIAQPADPLPVTLLPIDFKVVTKDNVDAFISNLEKIQGPKPVFIAITTSDYENLSLNLAELRRYIEQQTAIIVYYKTVTTNPSTNPSTTPSTTPSTDTSTKIDTTPASKK